MASRSVRLVLAAAAILAVAGAGVLLYRTRAIAAKQRENAARLREVAAALERFRAERGSYPVALRQAFSAAEPTDVFGRPLVYRSAETTFLLVSHGRDGIPDGGAYATAGDSEEARSRPCGSLDVDTVVSSYGVGQACGGR